MVECVAFPADRTSIRALSCRRNPTWQVSSTNDGHRLLLKQQFCCLHASIAMEPFLHSVFLKKIRYREQAHSLMVNHPAFHQLVRMPKSAPGKAIVGRFVESITPEPSQLGHSSQIADCS